MSLTLSPQKIEPGWFSRSFNNAFQLCKRKPLPWLFIYICLPMVFYLKLNILFAMFSALIILMMGTALAFYSDSHQKDGYWRILFRVLKTPELLFVIITAIAGYVLFIQVAQNKSILFLSFPGSDAWPWYSYSFGVSYLFVSLMMLWAITAMPQMIVIVLAVVVNRFPSFHNIMGIFSTHLIIDGLPWRMAIKLSHDAIMKNSHLITASLLPIIFVGFFPYLTGIFVPWLYCIYREIFWDQKALCPVQIKEIKQVVDVSQAVEHV